MAMIVSIAALCAGCATVPRGGATFEIPPGEYAAAFEAAKSALIDSRFELDRVDAAAGVISSQHRQSVGFARPWDNQQSHASQEVGEFLHRHNRVVRITFGPVPPAEPAEGTQAAPGEAPADLRTLDEPLVGTVRVVIVRLYRTGFRADPSGITLGTFSEPLVLSDRNVWPGFSTPVRRDTSLEKRVAESIRRKLTSAQRE